MKKYIFFIFLLLPFSFLYSANSIAVGDISADPPTIKCVAYYAAFTGDDNINAVAETWYRKSGDSAWIEAFPAYRVLDSRVTNPNPCGFTRPVISNMFAGSVVDLLPGTTYEVRLRITDTDGGTREQSIQLTTLTEPAIPEGLNKVVVNNFTELKNAVTAAAAGTHILLAPGTYTAPLGETALNLNNKKGTSSQPIVIQGMDRDTCIIDANGCYKGFEANNSDYLYISRLSVTNCTEGMRASGTVGMYLSWCRFFNVRIGFKATIAATPVNKLFIMDNRFEGIQKTWPSNRNAAVMSNEGVQVVGTSIIFAHNYVTGFDDSFSVYVDPARGIDVYQNDLNLGVDDGLELDDSERNVRCFRNRITNTYTGISTQPIWGGPVYVFRNVIHMPGPSLSDAGCTYVPAFKIHCDPSGVFFFHNTIVKNAEAFHNWAAYTTHWSTFRNNLFAGNPTGGKRVVDWSSAPTSCSFDYDGFYPDGSFYLGGSVYGSWSAFKAGGFYPNGTLLNANIFEQSVNQNKNYPDMVTASVYRLNAASNAINAGVRLFNFNDGFAGSAPDLGAVEYGSSEPVYGPRYEQAPEDPPAASGDPFANLKAYPNPFRIGSGIFRFSGVPQGSVLKIFGSDGQMIKRVSASDFGDNGTILWDGKNSDGEYCGPGIFYFELTDTSGNVKRGRLAGIR